MKLHCVLPAAAMFTAVSTAPAQVENLRITEVDPVFDIVEVTNTGPAFVTAEDHPFCYRLQYSAVIPEGTIFQPGQIRTFSANNLAQDNSDLWIYTHPPFTIAENIVHGLRWGPDILVGRTNLAVQVGIWPSEDVFVPSPPIFHTLAWDGVGFDPLDWYVDETPSIGRADATEPGVVPSSLVYPCSTQDFEGMLYGDELIAIDGWSVVNTSAPGVFTVRSVRDVNGVTGLRPESTSTQWLRVRDQDDGDVENRFCGPAIVAPVAQTYAWTFHVNVEIPPPGAGAAKPRLMIQHRDGAFESAWGVEFADTGASLVVTGIGGPEASAPLYPLVTPTGIGDWVKLTLAVDFGAETVAASANDQTPVTLPIDLSPTADPAEFRFCYLGEGAGNVGTMLIDDIGVRVGAAVGCTADIDCSGAVDFGDLLMVLATWGDYEPCPPFRPEDIDRNCSVGFSDVLTILAGWGPCG